MFGATTTVSRIDQIEKYIEDPEKVVVFQTAPAVRVALGEEFGMPYGSIVEGKMIAALRAVGGDYVFDTDFGADMTIMEEASELKYRLHSQKNCCPSLRAVARAGLNLPKSIFLNSFHIYRRLVVPSACSVLLLRLICKRQNIDPANIINVCVTPCTSKKAEIRRPEMNSAGRYMGRPEMRDTDYCITTRELAAWIKQKQIDFDALEDSKFDSMFGSASGGGNIFGNSGGVMESALRTLYYLETGEEAGEEFLNFEPVRGLEGVKEASLSLHNDIIHVAAISGLMNARKF